MVRHIGASFENVNDWRDGFWYLPVPSILDTPRRLHPEFHAFGYNRLVQRLACHLSAFSEMNP